MNGVTYITENLGRDAGHKADELAEAPSIAGFGAEVLKWQKMLEQSDQSSAADLEKAAQAAQQLERKLRSEGEVNGADAVQEIGDSLNRSAMTMLQSQRDNNEMMQSLRFECFDANEDGDLDEDEFNSLDFDGDQRINQREYMTGVMFAKSARLIDMTLELVAILERLASSYPDQLVLALDERALYAKGMHGQALKVYVTELTRSAGDEDKTALQGILDSWEPGIVTFDAESVVDGVRRAIASYLNEVNAVHFEIGERDPGAFWYAQRNVLHKAKHGTRTKRLLVRAGALSSVLTVYDQAFILRNGEHIATSRGKAMRIMELLLKEVEDIGEDGANDENVNEVHELVKGISAALQCEDQSIDRELLEMAQKLYERTDQEIG